MDQRETEREKERERGGDKVEPSNRAFPHTHVSNGFEFLALGRKIHEMK